MMTRRDFLQTSCLACAGGLIPLALNSCASHYITGSLEKDGIALAKSDFNIVKKGETTFRSFLIVRNDQLEFPIYLYRFSENEYSALWMECTHQGAELQASGDFLHCPSHGSEFNNRGAVSNGPAERNLRSFPVSVSNDTIMIDLRA